ncbi:MAG: fimbrial biogenesis outer membrane usher protein [Alphaproteobacteria bacterium]|nr:fimbrial biogenesis outer membrane usher protein [Alphaproteobacteria bacterium]
MLLFVPAASVLGRDEEIPLALEIIINGYSTGNVGAFTLRDGTVYATRAELRDLGFVVPDNAAGHTDPLPVSSLPGVKARLDMQRQTLNVTAADTALLPARLGTTTHLHLAPMTEPGFGTVIDYDALATYTSGHAMGGSLVDARAFSPYGLVRSTGIATLTPMTGQQPFVRLDSAYTYSEPDEMRRWSLGDLVSGGLAWTRPVRLGGAQLSRDFSLSPDFVTYPYPVISASAAVPSSVDVFVNGLRQFSETLQPGPFAISTLPVVTGAGEVTMAIQDALGRQTVTTLPSIPARNC